MNPRDKSAILVSGLLNVCIPREMIIEIEHRNQREIWKLKAFQYIERESFFIETFLQTTQSVQKQSNTTDAEK